MKKTWILFCAALLLSAGALGGCSDEKTASTPAIKTAVKKTGRNPQVKSRGGTAAGGENSKPGTAGSVKPAEDAGANAGDEKLVEDFPKDIPLYDDAQIRMSQLLEEKHAVATLATADQPEQVLMYYKAMLAKNGWDIRDPMTLGGTILLRGTKGDKSLNVQISREGDETGISLAILSE